ncbi:hypothetical protein ACFSKU_06115 [Pontibacter silvestris]|uniref:Uncharacterized protein n=1 Tax=Pontibacter silvestris TaxID=2305183 RepID=A0ABW4WUM6_9BACT|nr:hypothetical protein [Pontibacter silvestris]MCC9136409.1 hypothetical protein [Pontibacter silvestris]
MKKSYCLSMTFNNIMFDGRNKAYGAYLLRKNYSEHIIKAFMIATALFSGALVCPLIETMVRDEPIKYEKPVYDILKPIDIPLPPVLEKVAPKAIQVILKQQKKKSIQKLMLIQRLYKTTLE